MLVRGSQGLFAIGKVFHRREKPSFGVPNSDIIHIAVEDEWETGTYGCRFLH
jgi:hypothetical protein